MRLMMLMMLLLLLLLLLLPLLRIRLRLRLWLRLRPRRPAPLTRNVLCPAARKHSFRAPPWVGVSSNARLRIGQLVVGCAGGNA